MRELRLERLTWPDVEALIADGHTTAVIVAGASEQHGPHLPEGTDAILGEELALRVADRLGDALAAPVIRPGCSEHHMGFAGTITISEELLHQLLDAYVGSLRRHGFQRFVVFSSHGGNFVPLTRWAEARQDHSVIVLADLTEFVDAMLGPIRRLGRNDGPIPHADLGETSEMLVATPDLVHMDRAEPGFTGETTAEDAISRGLRAITPNGILGNPVGATAELGEAILESLVTYLVDRVRTAAGT